MIYLIIFIFISVVLLIVLNQPSFGSNPKGKRLERIKKSKQYLNGKFNDPIKPIEVSNSRDFFKFLKLFTTKVEDRYPSKAIEIIQSDLSNNMSNDIVFTWFGHSSYLIQIDNKNILIDPVFSKRASPFKFSGPKIFKGTDFINLNDLPRLDIVLITHDHYDHLDYNVVKALSKQSNIKFVTSLGVGAHLEKWGVVESSIIELDWHENTKIENLEFTAFPARHFTGRNIHNRFSTLWSSFGLKTASKNIFIGGDSGYGKHFKSIGAKYGPFDLTFMETGQYNDLWHDIHSKPEDSVKAHIDLQGKIMMPVHWAKFALAYHPWYEPIERVKKEAYLKKVQFITPKLGERVLVNEELPKLEWWK